MRNKRHAETQGKARSHRRSRNCHHSVDEAAADAKAAAKLSEMPRRLAHLVLPTRRPIYGLKPIGRHTSSCTAHPGPVLSYAEGQTHLPPRLMPLSATVVPVFHPLCRLKWWWFVVWQKTNITKRHLGHGLNNTTTIQRHISAFAKDCPSSDQFHKHPHADLSQQDTPSSNQGSLGQTQTLHLS